MTVATALPISSRSSDPLHTLGPSLILNPPLDSPGQRRS